jgi:hypothetical protein
VTLGCAEGGRVGHAKFDVRVVRARDVSKAWVLSQSMVSIFQLLVNDSTGDRGWTFLWAVRSTCTSHARLPPYIQTNFQGLSEVTKAEGALLCFDEVMTGFRISKARAFA